MRITALYVQNFKRLHDVAICPDADRTLILIGGKNANGKSSLLDALTAAFGGKAQQPADPVRHGADEATIRVELDGGELEVSRVISPDGESVLEVRDRLGPVKAPQRMLDGLIGKRFLDPLAFLQQPAKEQRAALMRIIPGAERIAGLNEKRDKAFAKRTEVGRDFTKAEGELARLPEVTIGTPIDVAALAAERAALAEQQHANAKLVDTLRTCERETEHARATLASTTAEMRKVEVEIERLKGRLVELGMKSAEWGKDVDTCEATERAAAAKVEAAAADWQAGLPRRDQLDADLARADAHNRAVFAAEAQAKRRDQVVGEVAKLGKEHGDLDQLIKTIDQRKADILAAAKLPVEGLAIGEHGIELAGVPFDQASDAERWRVALAISVAASPGLSDVWIRDGALLDDDSLALVAEHAAAAGKRVWIERVGTRDPGVIEIRDGRALTDAGPQPDHQPAG